MSIRRKTIEVMTLLYEAAKKAHTDLNVNTAALNPTSGLKRRNPALFKRIIWKPDPSDPDKGVFVATDLDADSEKLQKELPPGLLVTGPPNAKVIVQAGNKAPAPDPMTGHMRTVDGDNGVGEQAINTNMAMNFLEDGENGQMSQMGNQGMGGYGQLQNTNQSLDQINYLVSVQVLQLHRWRY